MVVEERQSVCSINTVVDDRETLRLPTILQRIQSHECVLDAESSDKIMTSTKGYEVLPSQCDQHDIERAKKLVIHNHRECALGDIKLWVGIKINKHPAFETAQCCQT